MSNQDESKDELNEAVQDSTEELNEAPTPEVDEEESRARANGWDPSKGSKTAKEYNLTGDLIDLKKEIQKKNRDIENILKYHENTVESNKTRFKEQLNYQLNQARSTGDGDQIERLVQQKLEFEQKEKNDSQMKIKQHIDEALDGFVSRNAHWYNPKSDDENAKQLVQRSIQLEQEITSGDFAKRTGVPMPADYNDVLKQIEMVMKYEYPDVVGKQQAPRFSLSANKSSVNKTMLDESTDDGAYSHLNAAEKGMYNTLKRIKGSKYTIKEFVKKVKKDLGDE